MYLDLESILLLEKGVWFACAALGFTVLFNVPPRAIIPACLLAAAGGLTKVFLMHWGVDIIMASLLGATLIGVLSIAAAHDNHAPPLIFSIPAVIPMVPGYLAYRMMRGIIELAGDPSQAAYGSVLEATVNYGIKAVFVLIALAIGVSIPLLVSRKTSVKHIRI